MMERALKERIIGAVVLVVFVVLVVPIFLDGPPDEGEVVTERVLLPGQDDQKTQTVVLDRDRTDPVPTNSTPETGERETQAPVQEESTPVVVKRDPPKTMPPKPAPEPVQETVTEAVAESTTGMWAVQLGSFSSKENAEKLAAGLRKEGYMAFLSEVRTGGSLLHRVRIGPQKNRESAEETAARLAKAGHNGQVVPHP